ncbi:MAG: lysophospholipid transporter LplT [Methylococcales bacterium]
MTIPTLLASQFLSAFADNAILFAIIAMVLGQLPDWYVPALQSVFLVAYVVLAPWVGPFADKLSKPKVLIIANLIKGLGVILLLLKVEPLLAYMIVGIGAALYSPAKYGILPEIAGHRQLVKVNSWIEGSTIAAIVLGTVAGAKIADFSITWALITIITLYGLSAITAFMLPRLNPQGTDHKSALKLFITDIRQFFDTPKARFAVLGASLFWATAATLRVLIVAWTPLVLGLHSASDIAELTLFLAIGIIVGSAVVPHLIPIDKLRRVRMAGYCMAIFIGILATSEEIWSARGVMFAIGLCGGVFIVPINAALQEIGHNSIGSGGAVAIQNFFANAAMLLAVGIYTATSAMGANPVTTLSILAVIVFVMTLLVSLSLPKEPVSNNFQN